MGTVRLSLICLWKYNCPSLQTMNKLLQKVTESICLFASYPLNKIDRFNSQHIIWTDLVIHCNKWILKKPEYVSPLPYNIPVKPSGSLDMNLHAYMCGKLLNKTWLVVDWQWPVYPWMSGLRLVCSPEWRRRTWGGQLPPARRQGQCVWGRSEGPQLCAQPAAGEGGIRQRRVSTKWAKTWL